MNTIQKFKQSRKNIPKLQTAWTPITKRQKSLDEWANEWKFRTTPASRSKVVGGWSSKGDKKDGVETDKQYTERRKKEATQRTWRSDAADIAHGVMEGALAMHPYTAIPYYGAKVGQDFFNGTYGWQTALNASVPLFHLNPQINSTIDIGKNAVESFKNSRAVSNLDNTVRRYLYRNRQLGTFNPYKEGSEWKWDANGELFGKQIGEGSEQFVYENMKDPNVVLKIDGTGYSTPTAMRHSVQQYQERNLIPYQEKAKFMGYMKGMDAATRTKSVYYLVYSQNRLRLETNTTPMYWDNVLVPKINKMMQSKGYAGSATTSFTNGKHTISDMSPYNIGYDKNGNLRFFDFYVE